MTMAAAALLPNARDWPQEAASLLTRLRERAQSQSTPVRVHAITNAAAQVLTANLLLAAGATPSLTTAPDEATAFTGRAGALLVNLGTLDSDRRAAIPWAIASARAGGKPWVLDPVFVDASPARLELARLCLAGQPAVLRCNPAEFQALAGAEASAEAVVAFARASRTVVALTGAVDRVSDGDTLLTIENGHPLMTRVTAMGCAATALIAALAALGGDALTAAAGALITVGIAGEIAAETANGPGTFQPAFLDAVAAMTPDLIRSRAKVA